MEFYVVAFFLNKQQILFSITLTTNNNSNNINTKWMKKNHIHVSATHFLCCYYYCYYNHDYTFSYLFIFLVAALSLCIFRWIQCKRTEINQTATTTKINMQTRTHRILYLSLPMGMYSTFANNSRCCPRHWIYYGSLIWIKTFFFLRGFTCNSSFVRTHEFFFVNSDFFSRKRRNEKNSFFFFCSLVAAFTHHSLIHLYVCVRLIFINWCTANKQPNQIFSMCRKK